MNLLKTTVAIAAVLAPLVLGAADASAQERRRMGPPAEGQSPSQYQSARPEAAPNGGGERRRMGPGGGGFAAPQAPAQVQAPAPVQPQFQGGDRGGRGGRGDGGQRFGGGQGYQGGQNFRGGQGYQGGQNFRGQNQAPAVQVPIQPNVQNRADRNDRRGFEGRQNFRGGDNRFDGRNDNRYDGRNFGGRDDRNRFDGRGFDNRGQNFRGDNRDRYDNRRAGGQRFSYRGRDFFRFRSTPYAWPSGYAYRSWAPRQILPSLFLGNQYFMDDFWSYGLDEPPYGYRWVRVGQDALLVDVYSGEILDVVPGVFYW